MKRWIDIDSDIEAQERVGAFWTKLKCNLDNGEFWADAIKKRRNDPSGRQALALANLPLPGAFREAAIATRALIRARRKADEPLEEELHQLYWLAAVKSFAVDYATRLREPGFNVLESVPGSRIRSLSYDYSTLGYRELTLLNKTDVRWFIEAWGEPESHSTLNAMHRSVWDEYESKLIERRREADLRFSSEIASILSDD